MDGPASGDLCVSGLDLSPWVVGLGTTLDIFLKASSGVNFCDPFLVRAALPNKDSKFVDMHS